VRFPLRDVDIEEALEALSLTASSREEFIVEQTEVRPGVHRSVDCEYFRLEHLEPGPSLRIELPAAGPHCLHALAGRVSVRRDGSEIGTLERGESAFIPAAVGAYSVSAESAPATVLRVTLPPYDE
jgi:mannose-6-phosphate isomerase class I